MAAAMTRYVEGLLFGIAPRDPLTFVSAALLFGVVAVVATFVPRDAPRESIP